MLVIEEDTRWRGGGSLGNSAYLMNHGLFIWSFSIKGEKKTEKK